MALPRDSDGISYVYKDPDAVLDYMYDWAPLDHGNGTSNWLTDGETITSYTVTPPAGLTLDQTQLLNDLRAITAWFSSGTDCASYDVVCHIQTSDGRQDDRTLRVKVKER